MIKSKFDTYQYIGQFIMTGLLVACIALFYPIFLGPHAVKLVSALGIFGVLLTIVFPIYILDQMKLNYKQITIDQDSKIITVKMFLLPITYNYPFEYYDGYIETTIKDKYDTYECIYLVKDNRLKYKMSGRFYSNIDELKVAISPLKNMGFVKFSIGLSIKIALNKAVL